MHFFLTHFMLFLWFSCFMFRIKFRPTFAIVCFGFHIPWQSLFIFIVLMPMTHTNPFYYVKFAIFCGIIGQMVTLSTYQKEVWNLRKNKYVKDTWKYGSILAIKKSLARIWLGFLKDFIKKIIIWCYITYWIMINNLEQTFQY